MRLTLEFLAYTKRVVPLIARGQLPDAEQLEDAAASILANVGEALDEDSPGDRRRFYRYAKRSAGECEKMLLGGAHLGLITPAQLDEGLRLLRDIKWDLHRLMNRTYHP